jgi:hypothetical protein
MPMFYLHFLLGGAFIAVWAFIATMLFRDRLTEIRRDRESYSDSGLAPPHYLKQSKKPRSARVA